MYLTHLAKDSLIGVLGQLADPVPGPDSLLSAAS